MRIVVKKKMRVCPNDFEINKAFLSKAPFYFIVEIILEEEFPICKMLFYL